MRILLAAVAAWCVPILAHADDILFQSATLGPTGITNQQRIDEQIPGTNVNVSVFVGARFELTQPVVTSRIGGHFTAGDGGGTLFGALVAFDGPDDLPDSTDLSTPDVLGSTLIPFPEPSADIYGEIELALDPGWYGVLFGSGLFGAEGSGGALRNSDVIPGTQFIGRQTGPWGVFTSPVLAGAHFGVRGQVVPEAASIVLAGIAALICLHSRSRQKVG